jgi:hypothetical protein
MQMLVTPMRREGVALTPEERGHYNAIRGNVRVGPEQRVELGRSTTVARLFDGLNRKTEGLPQLLDATLVGMAESGFVLSGIEFINGRAYAQSWWCRDPQPKIPRPFEPSTAKNPT